MRTSHRLIFSNIQIFLFLSFVLSHPAYAYAGPGAAVGLVVVVATVVFCVLCSVFINIVIAFRKIIDKIFKKDKKAVDDNSIKSGK